MEQEKGLKPDVLFLYDLELPADFVPRNMDGEVERFELWPMARVAASVRDSDDWKFNVNLTVIGLPDPPWLADTGPSRLSGAVPGPAPIGAVGDCAPCKPPLAARPLVSRSCLRHLQPIMGIDNHSSNFTPAARTDGRTNLVGLSREELESTLTAAGFEKFRARQVWHWIYHRGVTDFAQMSTLAKPARDKMAEHFVVDRPTPVKDLKSVDGTRKWLCRFHDGQEVEAVHIPEEDRGTLCVSSQVGCTLTCRFCHTGTQRLVRNLTADEIVGQVMLARDHLGEWPSPPDGRMLSNIVMMGMARAAV